MKNIFKNDWFIFSATYLLIRVFSYFFSPATPLYSGHILNTLVSTAIWLLVIYQFLRKKNTVWLIIAGEFILGGSGGFLAVSNISLRLLLLLTATFFYFFNKYREKLDRKIIKQYFKNYTPLFLLGIYMVFSGVLGWLLKNKTNLVISDFIPYLFLFYFFPLSELVKDKNFIEKLFKMLTVAIFGNLLFILSTLFIFSSGTFILQNVYYHWFRDVALGKITDTGNNFYRIVLNEHLLVVPLLLYFLRQEIKEKQNKIIRLIILSLILILSINLTRIYFVALFIGLLVLFDKNKIKKWFFTSLITGLVLFFGFTALHLLTSQGKNLGWEFFGLRLQSITSPQIEDSSLSRMLILPEAWKQIKERPLLGQGLGDEITVYSPILKREITTGQYDWGWLEIWAENGTFGLIVWLGFLLWIFKKIQYNDFKSPFLAFLIINITSPALFHVFGIILLIIISAKNYHYEN